MGLSKSVFRQFVKKRSQKRSQKKKKRIREKVDADEERLKKTQFQGRVFLALPKSLLAQGLRFSFSKKKRNKNLPKWCFSDPAPRTSKWLSTKTTTRSCCTSHLRSPTRRFWLALTLSRSLSRRSRPRALTPSGTHPGDGTRPSGAVFPLPPPRPSGSSISTETPSRSSSDTSPSRTTGSELSVRQHVIWRVSVRHRKTPSSFDRLIDTSMMGENRRDFFFFLNICIFIKKKVERKRHILTSFVVFFFSETRWLFGGCAVVNSSSPFFYIFFVKKIPSPRMKRNINLRNIHCFLKFSLLFHLAFDELCFLL